jgi:hypothetical protein
MIRRIDFPGLMVTTEIGKSALQGVVPGALPGVLNGPSGVAIISTGLIITDSGENVVVAARVP